MLGRHTGHEKWQMTANHCIPSDQLVSSACSEQQISFISRFVKV